MKLVLTPDEVKEFVLVGINNRFGGMFNTVQLDCNYGYFAKAVLTFEDAEDDMKEIPNE
jgi:hypothetical protein